MNDWDDDEAQSRPSKPWNSIHRSLDSDEEMGEDRPAPLPMDAGVREPEEEMPQPPRKSARSRRKAARRAIDSRRPLPYPPSALDYFPLGLP